MDFKGFLGALVGAWGFLKGYLRVFMGDSMIFKEVSGVAGCID